MKTIYITYFFFLLVNAGFAQPIPVDSLYLGQIPPGAIRKIFNLTTDPGYYAVEKITISPDGKEIYYEETNSNWSSYKFKYYKYSNNQWNEPADLFSNYYCLSLSPDGNFLYFENNNYNDGWISERLDTIWNAPSGFLNNFNVHSLNVTSPGNYYLSSNPSGGLGQRDICKLIVNNSDTSLVGLGRPINSGANEGDFFISNDETFIIFMSNKSGGFGSTDLYISYRKSNENNSWTNPKNMGKSVNTATDDFGPYVTSDSKYLFYESGYSSSGSIYWIRIDSLIDSLRFTNYSPYLNEAIPDQTGTVGQLFDFTIADSTFVDDDGNNTLTFSAKLSSGNPLPAWLVFDSLTCNFSGTPVLAQTLNISVTAADTAGASAFTAFRISIELPTEIKQESGQMKSFKIFPNPCTGRFTLSFPGLPGKTAMVEISDPEGKIVYKRIIENQATIDLPGTRKGLYLVKLISDNEIMITKVCLI